MLLFVKVYALQVQFEVSHSRGVVETERASTVPHTHLETWLREGQMTVGILDSDKQ